MAFEKKEKGLNQIHFISGGKVVYMNLMVQNIGQPKESKIQQLYQRFQTDIADVLNEEND